MKYLMDDVELTVESGVATFEYEGNHYKKEYTDLESPSQVTKKVRDGFILHDLLLKAEISLLRAKGYLNQDGFNPIDLEVWAKYEPKLIS